MAILIRHSQTKRKYRLAVTLVDAHNVKPAPHRNMNDVNNVNPRHTPHPHYPRLHSLPKSKHNTTVCPDKTVAPDKTGLIGTAFAPHYKDVEAVKKAAKVRHDGGACVPEPINCGDPVYEAPVEAAKHVVKERFETVTGAGLTADFVIVVSHP